MSTSISLVRVPDSEGNNNRGWIIQRVNAYHDDVLVGYLKIGYIPTDRCLQHYRDITDYLSKIQGYGITKNNKRWIQNFCWSFNNDIYGWHLASKLDFDIKNMNDVQIKFLIRRIKKEAYRVHKKKYLNFKKYHVDFPFVDFIQVKEPYRRRGIGTALYIEGGKWMKEIGLRLHSSMLQSNYAVLVWKSLEEKGIAVKLKKRKCDAGQRMAIAI